MLISICINAAFLYIPFQHIYTSKYRKNWLGKKKDQCRGYSPRSFAMLFPSLMQFILSFYSFPKLLCKQTWRQPKPIFASLTHNCSMWLTGLFAEQLVKALLACTVLKGYRRNNEEPEMWYSFTPRLNWFRLWKLQGTAQEVHVLSS